MYKIKRFFKKLIKLVKAIPLIWNDEDWDYDYLLLLMQWKLSNMENFLRSSLCVSEGSTDRADEIKDTLKLLQEYWEPEETCLKELNITPIETSYVFVPAEGCGSRLVEINKATNEPLTEEEEAEFGKIHVNLYKVQEDKWKKFWDSIKENAQGWWD